ncbi:hypothetical protein [Neomoorella thermoacetica]|uniref:hypothetical protein n=1 Tax=Neomoorella thermoacetica TaxID=1525 RepID=UPI0030D2B4BD
MSKNLKGKAEEMLEILEEAFPEGVPTSEIARRLFNRAGMEEKAKVYRLARSLRDQGHMVYGLGGVYYLCTPQKLRLVGEQRSAYLMGTIGGIVVLLRKAESMITELPEFERGELIASFMDLRERLKESLLRMASGL